jgi:hypothetical protein
MRSPARDRGHSLHRRSGYLRWRRHARCQARPRAPDGALPHRNRCVRGRDGSVPRAGSLCRARKGLVQRRQRFDEAVRQEQVTGFRDLRVNLRVCNQLRSGHSAHRAITGPQRPNAEPSLARRLTITSAPLISTLARRPDGRFRLPSAGAGGGKSGLHGSTVPGNARRGRPQGQCHREETAGARERSRPAGKGETVR